MSFAIEEWEIWHTYTTYFEATEIDLADSAQRLVRSGIATCAMLRDGRTFWKSSDSLQSGVTIVEIDEQGRFTFKLTLDEQATAKPEGFALETWGQAAYFLASESRVLGEYASLPPPYLRAFLGEYILLSTSNPKDKSQINVYPILIVYESGVMLIEFRMIGPRQKATEIANFIDSGVNLFRYRFSVVEVTPGLARYASRAHYDSSRWNILQRAVLLWRQAGHDIAVKQRTRVQKDEHFSFQLVALSGTEPETLSSIAQTLFHTTAYIIGRPRAGIKFLLWGQSRIPALGEFWSGRPHVHLIRFRGQCQTATENESCHGSDFGRILSRAESIDDNTARSALPQDARLFEDYSAYVISSATLWVWSLQGLKQQASRMDPNRGNLIYERQVLSELLEYGYMLHRSLYHRVNSFRSSDEVMAVKKDILELRLKMRETSHSGEIRSLLEAGWKELGLSELVSETEAALSLRESETRSTETVRATRIGWALTIVFGMVAVPALADQVVKPLWKLAGFRQFADETVTALTSVGIAALMVAVPIIIILLTFRRHD